MELLRQTLDTPLLRAFATVALAIVVVSILIRLARRALRPRIADSALRYRASKLVGVFGIAVVLLVIIVQFGGKLSGLALALGAASAGVAFALQEVIASFAGWLAVALGGFFRVGDRVQLGGIKGDVIDIGLIRTTLMEIGGWVDGDLYNGRIVRVANSFVFKEPVFNYSGEFPFLWDEITVPIAYGSAYAEMRAILERIGAEVAGPQVASARTWWSGLVASYRIEDARIEPMVTLVANDNWVAFTLRYVVDCRARRLTKDALFTRVLEAIDGTAGRVRMASTTLQIVGAPPLEVRLTGAPRAL